MFLDPSVSDSATRWQWPQNNAWPETRGAGSAFVLLFALGAPMYGCEPIHPAPKCQLKHCSSFHLTIDFQVDPDSHFSIPMASEHLSEVRVRGD